MEERVEQIKALYVEASDYQREMIRVPGRITAIDFIRPGNTGCSH